MQLLLPVLVHNSILFSLIWCLGEKKKLCIINILLLYIFFFRKWRLKRVPSCSFCFIQTAVITNGVTSSQWRRTACQTSLCPGPQTCSSSCPSWWDVWPPAPWLWNHLTVREHTENRLISWLFLCLIYSLYLFQKLYST